MSFTAVIAHRALSAFKTLIKHANTINTTPLVKIPATYPSINASMGKTQPLIYPPQSET
jgi:hypothetical protein